MASKNQDRASRQARQRLRDYEARQSLHRFQVARRARDNATWIIAFLVVCALATVAQVVYFGGGPGTPMPSPSATSAAGSPGDVPSPAIAENRTWTGTMTLNTDALGISLDGGAAPQGVSSFISLAQAGFYDGLSCHRLTTTGIYVLQCGDPKGDGSGGPGFTYGPVENAPANNVYPAGTIAMARTSNNGSSMGSQFFVVYEDSTIPADTAGGYTVLGHVTSGLDQLKADITSAGTDSGGTAPAVPTTIQGITVR